MSDPRKPDYKLSLRIGEEFHKVGVAWVNESGTVSIELNPFVRIPVEAKVKLMLIACAKQP